MRIKIYGKKGDAHTVAYKNFLRMAEIDFEYSDIFLDDQAKQHTLEIYDGVLKVPTLFVDDELYKTPSSDTFNKVMKELKLRG